jgi:hypothetical protein
MTIKLYRCDECRRWTGAHEEMLEAPNPFALDETINGCPLCRAIERFEMLCDEPGCDESASCGTPTKDGYRQTCSRHMPLTGAAE